MNTPLKRFGLFLVTGSLLASAAIASEKHDHKPHRQHDSHQHGHALMNMAIENNSLHIELVSPAANIVGFEHQPRSKQQRQAINKAASSLKNGTALYVLPKAAGCTLAEAKVESPLLENHSHGHDHHDHDKHEKKESHSEFHASYVFNCKNMPALKQVNVEVFEHFEGMSEIKVQLISNKGQTVKELSANHHKIVF